MASKWFNIRNKKQKETITNEEEMPTIKENNEPIRKAYNIFFNKDDNKYYQDVITYQGNEVVDFTREEVKDKLTVATNKIIRIFYEKTVLKKEDV